MTKILLAGFLVVVFSGSAFADPPAPAPAAINPFVREAPQPPTNPGHPPGGAIAPAQAAMFAAPPPPLVEQVPQQFTENRTLFDSLSVVGINGGKYATLRYPMSATGGTQPGMASPGMSGGGMGAAQGGQFRVAVVADGAPLWLNGRKYIARINKQTVRLVYPKRESPLAGDRKNKPATSEETVWAGEIDAPRGIPANPTQETTK